MKFHLKSAILIITLSFGFSAWNWNLEAKIKLKTESQLKKIFVPMLCYHRVSPEVKSVYDLSPEMFEAQLLFFKENGYHPITGLQYIKLQKHPEYMPDKPVVLTFDDGSIGHYLYAFPLLQKYGFQATFFVYPDVVFENTEKMITWSELTEMAQAGMDIQSHTMSHSYLTKPGADPVGLEYLKWLDRELKGSKTLLEQKLNRKVTLLAYPYGWFNRVVEAEAARAGYEGAFTVNWGVNRLDESPFRLKRRVVSNNLRPNDFQRYLSSRPLSLEIIAPGDAALFTEKPVIKFRLAKREVRLLDIMVRDEKGVVRSDAEGTFTFEKYQLKRAGYYQITISGFDDKHNFYQSSWGFDYRPSGATPTTVIASTPTLRRNMPTPSATLLPSASTLPTRRINTPTPTRAKASPTQRRATPTPTIRRTSEITPTPTRRMNTPTSRPSLSPTPRRNSTPTFRRNSTLAPTIRRASELTPTPTGRINTPTSRRSLTPTPRRNTPTPSATTTLTPTIRRASELTPTPTKRMNTPTSRRSLTPTPRRNTPTLSATTTLTPTIRRASELTPTTTGRMNKPTFRRNSTLAPTPSR